MADFTLNSPAATNAPWSPAGMLAVVSTMRSDASPDSFRASTAGVYSVQAHNTNYGSTITATLTAVNVNVSDDWAVGVVVRSGANAGCFIGLLGKTTSARFVSIDAAGTVTNISTASTWPTTPAAGDVYSCTMVNTAGTWAITATQNGSGITFSVTTSTTYGGETTAAAGFAFGPNNNNTTRFSQFTGTGVSGGGGAVNPDVRNYGGSAAIRTLLTM